MKKLKQAKAMVARVNKKENGGTMMDILLKVKLGNNKTMELTMVEAMDLYIELKKILDIQEYVPPTKFEPYGTYHHG